VNIARLAEEAAAGADLEVRQLIGVFRGDDQLAATTAAKALGALGIKAREAVPSLALALRDKENWRRMAAAEALEKIVLVGDFLPTLQAAAKDADPDVRAAAEKALEKIEGRSHDR
jgi:HEAT repeat protein